MSVNISITKITRVNNIDFVMLLLSRVGAAPQRVVGQRGEGRACTRHSVSPPLQYGYYGSRIYTSNVVPNPLYVYPAAVNG